MARLEGLLAGARVRVRGPGLETTDVPLEGPGTVHAGPLEVTIAERPGGWSWSVANRSDEAVRVDAVAVVEDAGAAGPEPRLFRNGYQSWSPTGVVRLGVDEDPSRAAGSGPLSRQMHNADHEIADAGELRSELVTVLDRGSGPVLCAGFTSGASHDGTLRLRLDGERVSLTTEAFLGGARLDPGARRSLHDVVRTEGDRPDAPELLAAWAAEVGAADEARTRAPYTVGWCSWYQYFSGVSEDDVRSNLARSADWPFDVFQVDDGFEASLGDWLSTNDRFPSDLGTIAADIAGAGRVPGIWLAPFLAAPTSEVARSHPGWMVEHESGRPLVGNINPDWGGDVGVLDTTDPGVLAHLEATAAALVAMGFPYLKLDFTYGPSLPGRYADPTRTPAERVRAGLAAIRRGAGDDAFVLGCGMPLGAGVGLVDGMRIGPDVAPWWRREEDEGLVPGYSQSQPATRNAWRSTLARSFTHRRLWLNDPDCLLLRTAQTRLSPEAVEAWARAVGMTGGLAVVSDDLALLGDDDRRLLEEVTALGRAVDRASVTGPPPRCDDLMVQPLPGQLSATGVRLVAAPGTDDVSARLERS
jgi:alpha-galactosidase